MSNVLAGSSLVLLTIVLAGIIGGVGSYILLNQGTENNTSDNTQENWKLSLFKSAFLGIVAAAVAPLFLEIGALGGQDSVVSQLVDPNIDEDKRIYSFLILLGFGIVAALSAPRFLRNVSQTMLNDLGTEVNSLRQATIAEHQTTEAELIQKQAEIDESVALLALLPDPEVVTSESDPSDDLLSAFLESKERAPEAIALKGLLRLTTSELRDRLDEAEEAGLIWRTDETNEFDQQTWELRGYGRRRALKIVGLNELDSDVLQLLQGSEQHLGVRRPTTRNIAESLNQSEAKIEQTLLRLLKFGCARESSSVEGGWRIKKFGRKALIDR